MTAPLSAQTKARVVAQSRIIPWHLWLAGSALVIAGAVWALPGQAQDEPLIVSHGYSFFGDLKYPADFAHLDYVNPDAPKGGEISEATLGTFDSFNPYTLKGNPAAMANIGHESLMTSTADDPTALYCFICSTVEYPESLEWATFTMRPEVRFADGTPMTANDVKFTFDLFMEQGLESFRAAFGSMVQSVDVIDDLHVRFTFTPDSPIRDRMGLAGGISILSQAWFTATDAHIDAASNEPFLGSGPYVLESSDLGRRVIYSRNPEYWGNDLPINVGRNNFDRLRIEYFGDTAVAFEAFKAGEYTFRNENSSLQWATGYAFPALDNAWVIKTELLNGSLASAQSFVFNLREPKFQDPRVREAIGLMFNFEWSNATLFYGLYTRTQSFWGNSDLEATGTPSEGEIAILQPLVDEGLLDASILTAEVVIPPTSSSERQSDRANFRRASALLDEAGWIVGDDGLRRMDGQTLDVAFLESQASFDRILNPYIENLKALGINARLDRVDPAQATQRRDDSQFDMASLTPAMALEPATELEQWFGSESAAESNRNLMGLQDPGIDRLIKIVVAAETREEMVTAVHALDRVLRSKLFWVPQWFKGVHTVAYYDMFEHPATMPPYSLGEMDFWWFSQAKYDALVAAGAFQQ